jgi:hypothetical protein
MGCNGCYTCDPDDCCVDAHDLSPSDYEGPQYNGEYYVCVQRGSSPMCPSSSSQESSSSSSSGEPGKGFCEFSRQPTGPGGQLIWVGDIGPTPETYACADGYDCGDPYAKCGDPTSNGPSYCMVPCE